MPKTFCNDALTLRDRHRVGDSGCTYIMSASWIDTAQPSDMMDYDFTMPIHELKAVHESIRLMNIAVLV